MKKPDCLCFFCVLFLALFAVSPSWAADLGNHPAGIVARCFDGDTFKLTDRRVVRLAGIDAPEIAHKDKKAQFYAKEARQSITDIARGKKVSLVFPGKKQKDPFGRLIANAILEDGSSLNEMLVEQGAAFFYPHRDLDPEFQERLRQLQSEAIQERRGLWANLLSLPLASEKYVGNRSTLRFFPMDCPDIQHIKPRNRIHFGTLMDAFLAGYAPARVCIFWPSALY